MHREQFLETYPRQLPDRLLDMHTGDIGMRRSREWSHTFGEVLHDTLQGKESSYSYEELHNSYVPWAEAALPSLLKRADNMSDSEQGYKQLTELNFHVLNQRMLGSWLLLLDNDPRIQQSRGMLIKTSQDALAIQGYMFYQARDRAVGPKGSYEYFSEENARRRQAFEGRANEHDAGIVLLEMMRRNKDIIVVPGPIQFEKFSNPTDTTASNTNVDFIAIRGEHAVGIQVKSHVTDKDYAKYDRSRVVLIDAAVDLGNERRLRISQESTRQKAVAWGGTICTQRVAEIPMHGKNAHLMNHHRQEILRNKFLAKQLVAGTKPYFEKATQIVTKRVLDALAA